MNSKEGKSEDFCPNNLQEFGLRLRLFTHIPARTGDKYRTQSYLGSSSDAWLVMCGPGPASSPRCFL